jgi:hypothetical protein
VCYVASAGGEGEGQRGKILQYLLRKYKSLCVGGLGQCHRSEYVASMSLLRQWD